MKSRVMLAATVIAVAFGGVGASSHEAETNEDAVRATVTTANDGSDRRLGPVETVDAFTEALQSGDQAKAIEWLAANLLVYESGHAEVSRDQYVAEHLGHDIAFLADATSERLARVTHVGDTVAWVATRVRTRARKGSDFVDLVGTETMILHREANGWRIHHIHWSSAKEN